MSPPKNPKKRRRVVRLSDAVDYDRTADRTSDRETGDEDRMVILDSELGSELIDEPTDESTTTRSREFYEEQKPPHYG